MVGLYIYINSFFEKLGIYRDGGDAVGVLTVDIGRHTSVRCQADIRVFEDVVFEVPHGPFSTNKKKCVLVIQHPHFIGRHKLASRDLPVDRVASVSSTGLSIGVCINRFLAKQLGNVFVGRLLVAAKIYELVAVAHNGFPLLLKQGFELREVLNDNAHRDFPAPHGRKQLVKLIGKGDVGELVHDKVDMDREPAAVDHIGLIVELLEKLRIQHSNDEIEAAVVIWNDRIDGGLALTKAP